MKTTYFFSIAILFIAFALVIGNFSPAPAAAQQTATPASLHVTPTPAESVSVIGSTDGIMLMGVIISLIIIAPLLLRRKKP